MMRFPTLFIALLAIQVPVLGLEPERPDVILLMTDQHRFDELSFLGTPGADTPAIDALCRTGAVFTHAFVPTPQCSPARGSILTGRWPHRSGVMGNVSTKRVPAGQSGPLSSGIPNLATTFAKAGYDTAYFGKWHLGSDPRECGFASSAVSSGREISLHLADFLKARASKPQRPPMLIVISWINPHDIYQINNSRTNVDPQIQAKLPASVDDNLKDKPYPQRHFLEADQGVPFQEYTHEQWMRYVRYYHQLTSLVDADIGRVRELMKDHFPNAITLFTADHGDLGGAHGLPYKCPAMYEELMRVPFILHWPGHIEPGQSEALIGSIDILPTLCDLAAIPIPQGIDGQSVQPLVTGSEEERRQAADSWRKAIFGEYYGKQAWRAPIRMIRTARWKYNRYTKYGEELYDLQTDPCELQNLTDDPKYSDIKQDLTKQLDAWMLATDDPFPALRVTDRQGKPIE